MSSMTLKSGSTELQRRFTDLQQKEDSSNLTKGLNKFVDYVVKVTNRDIRNFRADSESNGVLGTQTDNLPLNAPDGSMVGNTLTKRLFSSYILSLTDSSPVSKQSIVNRPYGPLTEKDDLIAQKKVIENSLLALEICSDKGKSALESANNDLNKEFRENEKAWDDFTKKLLEKFPNNSLKNIVKNLRRFFNRSSTIKIIRECETKEGAARKELGLHHAELKNAIKKLDADTVESKRGLLQQLADIQKRLDRLSANVAPKEMSNIESVGLASTPLVSVANQHQTAALENASTKAQIESTTDSLSLLSILSPAVHAADSALKKYKELVSSLPKTSSEKGSSQQEASLSRILSDIGALLPTLQSEKLELQSGQSDVKTTDFVKKQYIGILDSFTSKFNKILDVEFLINVGRSELEHRLPEEPVKYSEVINTINIDTSVLEKADDITRENNIENLTPEKVDIEDTKSKSEENKAELEYDEAEARILNDKSMSADKKLSARLNNMNILVKNIKRDIELPNNSPKLKSFMSSLQVRQSTIEQFVLTYKANFNEDLVKEAALGKNNVASLIKDIYLKQWGLVSGRLERIDNTLKSSTRVAEKSLKGMSEALDDIKNIVEYRKATISGTIKAGAIAECNNKLKQVNKLQEALNEKRNWLAQIPFTDKRETVRNGYVTSLKTDSKRIWR